MRWFNNPGPYHRLFKPFQNEETTLFHVPTSITAGSGSARGITVGRSSDATGAPGSAQAPNDGSTWIIIPVSQGWREPWVVTCFGCFSFCWSMYLRRHHLVISRIVFLWSNYVRSWSKLFCSRVIQATILTSSMLKNELACAYDGSNIGRIVCNGEHLLAIWGRLPIPTFAKKASSLPVAGDTPMAISNWLAYPYGS